MVKIVVGIQVLYKSFISLLLTFIFMTSVSIYASDYRFLYVSPGCGCIMHNDLLGYELCTAILFTDLDHDTYTSIHAPFNIYTGNNCNVILKYRKRIIVVGSYNRIDFLDEEKTPVIHLGGAKETENKPKILDYGSAKLKVDNELKTPILTLKHGKVNVENDKSYSYYLLRYSSDDKFNEYHDYVLPKDYLNGHVKSWKRCRFVKIANVGINNSISDIANMTISKFSNIIKIGCDDR